ncbi:hypothetical protein M9H77_05653 [Catharanthus roseus]|uniref:Uncharacterized protein n=1 Tax=Catharanthus roseus TaxID=4058 RepID=A0ACC0CHJ8_CATRO|nr:hypothetical protein M9H77_05653 [Catharanthus roseus]
MANKIATVFIIAILFCFSLSIAAARLGPPDNILPAAADPIMKTQQKEIEVEASQSKAEEEKCGGRDEECLMRRTLAAHLDYIYTQNHNKHP